MIKSSITISNKLGLHARASAKLTKLAGSFKSDIHLSRNERRVNAKSIMGVMMLAAAWAPKSRSRPRASTRLPPCRRCAPSSSRSSAKASSREPG
jgi:phosphotransferase system HPr (HPr) family protein